MLKTIEILSELDVGLFIVEIRAYSLLQYRFQFGPLLLYLSFDRMLQDNILLVLVRRCGLQQHMGRGCFQAGSDQVVVELGVSSVQHCLLRHFFFVVGFCYPQPHLLVILHALLNTVRTSVHNLVVDNASLPFDLPVSIDDIVLRVVDVAV